MTEQAGILAETENKNSITRWLKAALLVPLPSLPPLIPQWLSPTATLTLLPSAPSLIPQWLSLTAILTPLPSASSLIPQWLPAAILTWLPSAPSLIPQWLPAAILMSLHVVPTWTLQRLSAITSEHRQNLNLSLNLLCNSVFLGETISHLNPTSRKHCFCKVALLVDRSKSRLLNMTGLVSQLSANRGSGATEVYSEYNNNESKHICTILCSATVFNAYIGVDW